MHFEAEFPPAFRDDDACLQFLFDKRCRDIKCSQCERHNALHRHSVKQCWTCTCGRLHVYPRKGTPFERSALPLSAWFYALYLVSCREPSAKDVERALGVTYATAWKMTTRLRRLRDSAADEVSGLRLFWQLLWQACGR